ncbi:MAG TPA: filamin, partial [Planctomycetaceae bacterium]|nr:filamin [Planctomycetaceae bacterium]
EFINADYTFMNENLAKFYGNDKIKGDQFQKVSLDKSKRAGLITQASILTLTSNPGRTSPVKRGKWIMENILGTPPPA